MLVEGSGAALPACIGRAPTARCYPLGMGDRGSKPMKSAYQLALERLDEAGIERPREEAFSHEILEAIEQARSRARAKIAELEILHRKKMQEVSDGQTRRQQEEEYRTERARIEEGCEREIAKIRRSGAAG